MDVKDIATYGTAIAVVGTGSIVGGNVALTMLLVVHRNVWKQRRLSYNS